MGVGLDRLTDIGRASASTILNGPFYGPGRTNIRGGTGRGGGIEIELRRGCCGTSEEQPAELTVPFMVVAMAVISCTWWRSGLQNRSPAPPPRRHLHCLHLGPWGPVVMTAAYIPLAIFAIPASILTLGGGYLYGLPIGFIIDSVGGTVGATAAFLIGRTFGRSYVISKLKNYPKFQAITLAIQNSGFKARILSILSKKIIVFLLRLVPLLPFTILNYLLSVTPVHIGKYMLASWLGMMILMALGFMISVILIVYITKACEGFFGQSTGCEFRKAYIGHNNAAHCGRSSLGASEASCNSDGSKGKGR
ncbi:hypothetical protein Patl1_03422 [Pistacia atlantica]|uniref:Uncharacterized protein n=1 Tax=Pistacia atlantica TaxID=434234 RepID=A0ACC1C6C9_9ROSI|nr:hypothetical protein Patl1_03422 [Pistacia atlantica]